MSQQSPIEARFVLVVKHQMKAISTMIDNANDAKLTKVTSRDVDTIFKLLEAMEKDGKQATIVEMFIGKCEFWDIIDRKDLKALEKSFPAMFAGLPLNLDSLSEPIRIYYAERAKPSKKMPVISDKSMEAMWVNLDKMIKASIIYDNENGNKFKEQHQLGKYYAKYGIDQ